MVQSDTDGPWSSTLNSLEVVLGFLVIIRSIRLFILSTIFLLRPRPAQPFVRDSQSNSAEKPPNRNLDKISANLWLVEDTRTCYHVQRLLHISQNYWYKIMLYNSHQPVKSWYSDSITSSYEDSWECLVHKSEKMLTVKWIYLKHASWANF